MAAVAAAARRDPSQHYTVGEPGLDVRHLFRPTASRRSGVALKFAGTLWSGVGHYPSDAGQAERSPIESFQIQRRMVAAISLAVGQAEVQMAVAA